ncbi:hypothetical protein [endosymbiont GvMRE of Glomus versiforme]|uniref:hypothetical protein n=1 Tax=endosymbiont GvMRE of Glomus versiforme TaxID=2039283 RepID=UPI000ECC8450|nr:hypothetical protein [endosymbiont GvMRE of Glomus versiforme]RHZ36068.1 hypothetical protein GvMRE_Ic3g147 [endosymbiont GvMRE of Glomus versiforme]
MTTTFKCAWCKHSHDLTELEAIGDNKRRAETYLAAKAKYEDKRSNLPFRNDLSSEQRKIKDQKYQNLIQRAWKELNDLQNTWICVNCFQKAQSKAQKKTGTNKTHTCAVCKNVFTSKPRKVHVANKQHIGIEPRRISKVCEGCWENEIIEADYYCPRTSDGRDSLEPGQKEFDCLCVVKEKYKGGRHLDQTNYEYDEEDKDIDN